MITQLSDLIGCRDLELVVCIGPHQVNWIDDTHATITYPVGSNTVISVDPERNINLVEFGTQGPYEICLVQRELGRIVYAPLGAGGEALLFPYTDKIPNV